MMGPDTAGKKIMMIILSSRLLMNPLLGIFEAEMVFLEQQKRKARRSSREQFTFRIISSGYQCLDSNFSAWPHFSHQPPQIARALHGVISPDPSMVWKVSCESLPAPHLFLQGQIPVLVTDTALAASHLCLYCSFWLVCDAGSSSTM